MVDGSGARTALGAALDEAAPPVLQPALFPASDVGSLPASQADRRELLQRRGPGRPAGAMNRRSRAFRDYVLARGEHPVDGLIEAYSRPVHLLAEELGCTRLEAFRAQMDARRVVLEYVEGKMPVTVNANINGAIPVIFEMVGDAGPLTVDNEFFQELSGSEHAELDKGKSNSDS